MAYSTDKSRAPPLWGPRPSSSLADEARHLERWRKRTWQLHASVLISHLYAFTLFLGHCWAGYVPLHPVLMYGLWISAGMAFITWAYASGWSQTQSDPGLFFWHQLIAVTGVLALLVAAPKVAFQALVMLLVFSTDGFLAPRRTSFWMTWSCALVAIALAVYSVGPQMQMTTDTLIGQFLVVGVMLGAVIRCSVLVTYFRSMQYRLSASNEKLAVALKHIETLARNDDLTGLSNRRGVMERLQQCIHAAQRRDAPFCIALLDIDFFKQVNDRLGHDIGDQVLRAFGDVLTSQTRITDCAGRYGGEEFLLVLCDTQLHQAEVLLERIRACAESYPWSQLVNQELSVTCTLGATQYQKGETAEALISRADRAMYQGKALGRNRLVLA
ncbi:GGDEF domain-containing protein [Comamonas testosteroni]|uniref:GGDEF domain-containing protein n=1 Tax=Comamonas testosteroni TaxID=285 RepID=UPI0025EFF87D|nr:GGDEF domain-containing protein [Comamonas testosteroni]MEB5966798.1 GGDEF domain-containing protein [Comamonas testosteroni]